MSDCFPLVCTVAHRSYRLPILFAVFSSFLFAANPLHAQRQVTLDECLRIAHEQAPALLEAKRNYQIASSNAEATSRSLRSKVDLTLSAPVYTDNTTPVYNPVTGTTDLLTQRETQFGGGLSVSQPIYWTGGTLSVSGNLYRRFQQAPDGPEIHDYLGLGSIELDQPIFKANELRMTERESEINLSLAYSSYVTQWASVNFTIKNFFYSLYQAEQELKIQHDEVDASQANYTLASNKFKAGLIAEVDALQLEVDLASAQTDLFDRERRLLSAERNLLGALGMPLNGKLSAKLDSVPEVNVTVDADEAVRIALENREDVRSARFDIERGEIAKDRVSNSRTINAFLIGTFGASQNDPQLSMLTQHPYVNRGLSLIVNVPLFDWGAQSLRMDAAESGIELDRIALQVKEQQVEQEVRSVIEQLEAAKKQVEVAKKSVAVAQKAYDLSRSRFDAGKITSQDLTLAQDRLTRARFSALTAQVAEQLALADLTQKTLYDFVNHHPIEIEQD